MGLSELFFAENNYLLSLEMRLMRAVGLNQNSELKDAKMLQRATEKLSI